MKKFKKVLIVRAFSTNGAGGNPAGVVLDADDLDDRQKLDLARQVGLSETAFVSDSVKAGFKLDFFTPTKQIAHCGHATIATFTLLKQSNRIGGNSSSKETIDGVREIYFEGNMAFMEQQKPAFISISAAARVKMLASLGLGKAALLPGFEPEIVNTGNNFLIIPVKEERILEAIKPDLETIAQLSEKLGLIGFYLFALTPTEGVDATTRMFAPHYGIPEEAATGMAAGPLAAYLDKYRAIDSTTVTITQGRFMKPASPSTILVRLEKTNAGIQRLFVGGSAIVAADLTYPVEDNTDKYAMHGR